MAPRGTHPTADFVRLRAALDAGEEVVVHDTRMRIEWQDGHLPSAGHVPLHELDSRLADIPAGQVWIHWALTGAITAAAVVGILVGNVLVRRVPDAALRRGIGWLVAASAATMLGREVLALVGGSAASHVVTALALGGILSVVLLFASCPPCRTRRLHPDRPAHA